MALNITFFHHIQVLPENVPHEGRGTGQEVQHGETAEVRTRQVEVGLADPFQAELVDGPPNPGDHVLFAPFLGICVKKNQIISDRNGIEERKNMERPTIQKLSIFGSLSPNRSD